MKDVVIQIQIHCQFYCQFYVYLDLNLGGYIIKFNDCLSKVYTSVVAQTLCALEYTT